MKIAGIICAKGNSRRLPRKNLYPFCGLPLMEWTLIALDSARQVDGIYVVTESDEIASLARRYGANIVWQPEDEIVAAEAANKMGGAWAQIRGSRAAENDGYGAYIAPMVTGPLRKPGEIDAIIDLWRLHPDKNVASMARCTDADLWKFDGKTMRLLIFDKSGSIYRGCPEGAIATLAVWEKMYVHPDGRLKGMEFADGMDVYWPYVVEPWQVTDIDYLEDLEICEYWMQKKILKGRGKEAYYE